MFNQSLIKTLKCLTKVLSKHLKQSTLKSYVMDPEQNARDQKELNSDALILHIAFITIEIG